MDNQTPNQAPPATNSTNNPPAVQTPPPPKSFLPTKIILLIVIALILLGAGGTYLALSSKPKSQACTQEAKICPDGTSVGRTGPNCAFAPCPTKPTPTTDPTVNWKTYSDQYKTFSVKHPSEFNETQNTYTTGTPLAQGRKDGGTLTNFLPATRGPEKENEMSVTFDILDKKESETLKEFVNRWINGESGEFKPGNIDGDLKETITVDNKDSLRYEGNLGPSVKHVEVYIPKSTALVIRVAVYANSSGMPNDQQIALLKKILSTFKFTETIQESVLKIPEYDVQIALSDEIKDAYYINTTASKGYVYLKVHSLDTESQCKKDDSSTASLSRIGKDEINPMTDGKFSDSFKGKVIGNFFYYIDLAQYSCADTTEGKAKLEKVRSALTTAEITQ